MKQKPRSRDRMKDARAFEDALRADERDGSRGVANLQRTTTPRPQETALSAVQSVMVASASPARGQQRRASSLDRSKAETLNDRGVGLLRLKLVHEALKRFDEAAALKPDFAEAIYNRAAALKALGLMEEAVSSYDRALQLKPDWADALINRGVLLLDLRRVEDALASFNGALALKPSSFEALINRGIALRGLNRLEDALASYDSALALVPGNFAAHYNRADVLRDLRRPREALAAYDQALACKPDYIDAWINRGVALMDLDRIDEALASFEGALGFDADHINAHINRGNALRRLGRFDEALASYDHALARTPANPAAHYYRGIVLRDLERPDDAIASYDQALRCKADFAEALEGKAILLNELGRFAEAGEAIGRAIVIAPRTPRFHFSLGESRQHQPGDPQVRALEDLARDMTSFDEKEQVYLRFALSKAYADMGDHARSFENMLAGNALKRRHVRYDEASVLSALEETRSAFPRSLLRANASQGDPSSTPIFIVGMPRSGTSLIEQILASHPKAFGVGEHNAFTQAIMRFNASLQNEPRASDAGALVSAQDFRRLGASYLQRLTSAAPAAQRIADKAIENFRYLGLIHLALPNARFVHVRRAAMDTCFSCFSRLFTEDNLPYTYNFGELGRYYRAHEALMAHWRNVLPHHVMIDVQYEDVVADLQGQARRLIAFCGLEWDARCLEFHLTQRQVRTASVSQVRRPLYQKSVGSWRAFEAFLQPLRAEAKLA